MGEQRRSEPSFFKVLFHDDFTRQLLLPTAFVQKHGEILRENVMLRARSGESWVVQRERVEYEKCYFTLGWPKFAEDWGLRMGEFLVFWFAGKSTFDVSVFGISGCERMIPKRKSGFEISDSDEEVLMLTKDSSFTKRGYRDLSNKRAKNSILEKEATRNPRNVDSPSPLYLEKVLKAHHRSRVPKKHGAGVCAEKRTDWSMEEPTLLNSIPGQM